MLKGPLNNLESASVVRRARHDRRQRHKDTAKAMKSAKGVLREVARRTKSRSSTTAGVRRSCRRCARETRRIVDAEGLFERRCARARGERRCSTVERVCYLYLSLCLRRSSSICCLRLCPTLSLSVSAFAFAVPRPSLSSTHLDSAPLRRRPFVPPPVRPAAAVSRRRLAGTSAPRSVVDEPVANVLPLPLQVSSQGVVVVFSADRMRWCPPWVVDVWAQERE